MILGHTPLGVLGDSLLGAVWFDTVESLLECVVGLMIGTELIWSRMKKAGRQILVTTITESLGTFLVVSLVFGVLFWFAGTAHISRLFVRRDRPGHRAGALSVCRQ